MTTTKAETNDSNADAKMSKAAKAKAKRAQAKLAKAAAKESDKAATAEKKTVTLKHVLLNYLAAVQGLDKLQAKAESINNDLSKDMMSLAGSMYTGTETLIDYVSRGKAEALPKDLVTYLSACEVVENDQKDASKAKTGKAFSLPRNYSQLKSNIKQAWSLGLVITDYATESQLRKALNEHRRAVKLVVSDDDVEAGKVESSIIEGMETTIQVDEAMELLPEANPRVVSLLAHMAEMSVEMDNKVVDAMCAEIGQLVLKYRLILESVLPDSPNAPVKAEGQ